MFTVFGANGNTGGVVADALLAAGKKVRLAVRDPNKVQALTARGAEAVIVNLLDPASVSAAIKGSEGVYFLVPPDAQSADLVGRAQKIIEGFAAALKANPVAHVVILSSVGAQIPSGTGPIVIAHHAEKTLGAIAGTRFTFVRAAYFMENILGNAHPMKADGVLPVFGGGENHPFPMIATRDIGNVAAKALLDPPSQTEVIELQGPVPYSFVDAAAFASKVLGRTVTPQVLPLEALVPAFTSFGISPQVAELYREMTEAFGSGRVGFEGKGRSVRGTTTLEQVLRTALG